MQHSDLKVRTQSSSPRGSVALHIVCAPHGSTGGASRAFDCCTIISFDWNAAVSTWPFVPARSTLLEMCNDYNTTVPPHQVERAQHRSGDCGDWLHLPVRSLSLAMAHQLCFHWAGWDNGENNYPDGRRWKRSRLFYSSESIRKLTFALIPGPSENDDLGEREWYKSLAFISYNNHKSIVTSSSKCQNHESTPCDRVVQAVQLELFYLV